MSNTDYSVILVHTTSHSFRVEKLMKANQIDCRLIPVPRHLGSNCGTCVRIEAQHKELAQKLLDESSIEIDKISSM